MEAFVPLVWPDSLEHRRKIAEAVNGIQGLIISGIGAPDGAIAAAVGTIYLRTDGGVGSTLYVKEAGDDANGWAAK